MLQHRTNPLVPKGPCSTAVPVYDWFTSSVMLCDQWQTSKTRRITREREREPARGPDLQGRVEREAELRSYEGGNGQMDKRQFPDGRALGIPWEEDRALG